MPDPRNTMKRKKQQILSNLETCDSYMFDILTILEYEPEYAQMYIEAVQLLKSLYTQSPDYSLVQYWEMIKDQPEMPDLGTRYAYLITIIDLYLQSQELQTQWLAFRL